MRINTKMRLAALLYLMAAYAVALPTLALFTDLVINGGIIDMWQGSYSFLICVKFSICSLPGWALSWVLSTGYFSLENTVITIRWINILSSAGRYLLIYPAGSSLSS